MRKVNSRKANIGATIQHSSRGEGEFKIVLVLQKYLFEGVFIGKLIPDIYIALISARAIATCFFNNPFKKESQPIR
jgi:hypothetical protein